MPCSRRPDDHLIPSSVLTVYSPSIAFVGPILDTKRLLGSEGNEAEGRGHELAPDGASTDQVLKDCAEDEQNGISCPA